MLEGRLVAMPKRRVQGTGMQLVLGMQRVVPQVYLAGVNAVLEFPAH